MPTQCTPEPMLFARLDGRDVVADFGGGAIYARAAAWIMGLDHWSEARWDEEAGMASPARTPTATAPEAAPVPTGQPRPRRGGWLDTGWRGSWL